VIRILGTVLVALLGLAFGSFLNVCLSRWPEGESVVTPRSHCRSCRRMLAWWENIPLASWIALHGRCRGCNAKIGWRYPLVELAVAVLWGVIAWETIPDFRLGPIADWRLLATGLGGLIFCWLMAALAVLDAEKLWLPDFLTYPGMAFGLVMRTGIWAMGSDNFRPAHPMRHLWLNAAGALASAGLILLIRWIYWLIRRREGIGLGDAKLMGMLGAWLGLSGALLSFSIGVILGAVLALVLLGVPSARRESDTWLLSKLPLGTFLCIGGVISALWGEPLMAAYLRLVGW
jgi:leader peptidase (prepilin peptidase) / N-methyltransferase